MIWYLVRILLAHVGTIFLRIDRCSINVSWQQLSLSNSGEGDPKESALRSRDGYVAGLAKWELLHVILDRFQLPLVSCQLQELILKEVHLNIRWWDHIFQPFSADFLLTSCRVYIQFWGQQMANHGQLFSATRGYLSAGSVLIFDSNLTMCWRAQFWLAAEKLEWRVKNEHVHPSLIPIVLYIYIYKSTICTYLT